MRPPAPPVTRSSPRAERDYQRAVRERAKRQRRRTAEPAHPRPDVVIDEGVFGPGGERFVITSAAPTEVVVTALERANRRFLLVDALGGEHADLDDEKAQHARRADKAAYLREKLEERAESERKLEEEE